jgi:hypothetical protein
MLLDIELNLRSQFYHVRVCARSSAVPDAPAYNRPVIDRPGGIPALSTFAGSAG